MPFFNGLNPCQNVYLPENSPLLDPKKREKLVVNQYELDCDIFTYNDVDAFCVDKKGLMYYYDDGKIFSTKINGNIMTLREYSTQLCVTGKKRSITGQNRRRIKYY